MLILNFPLEPLFLLMKPIKGTLTKVAWLTLNGVESVVVSLLRNAKTKVIQLNKKQKPDANFFRRFHGLSRFVRVFDNMFKILFWIYIAPIILIVNAWWVITMLFIRLFLGKSKWLIFLSKLYQEMLTQITQLKNKIITSEAFELMLYCLTALLEVK